MKGGKQPVCFPIWHPRTVTEQGVTITWDNQGRETNILFSRSGNAASARICYPQELHLPPSTVNRGGNAQGSEGASRLGLGYWKKDPTTLKYLTLAKPRIKPLRDMHVSTVLSAEACEKIFL